MNYGLSNSLFNRTEVEVNAIRTPNGEEPPLLFSWLLTTQWFTHCFKLGGLISQEEPAMFSSVCDDSWQKEGQDKKKQHFYNLFNSVQSLSPVRLFATPWTAAHQASLSITNSRSSLKLTSIESVMPPGHLILCRPLFFLPPIPPSIRVFSNESTLRRRWP